MSMCVVYLNVHERERKVRESAKRAVLECARG